MGDLYPKTHDTIQRNYKQILSVLGMIALLLGLTITAGYMYHIGLFTPPQDKGPQPYQFVILSDGGTFDTSNCTEPISYSSHVYNTPASDRNISDSVVNIIMEYDTNLTASVRLRVGDVWVILDQPRLNMSLDVINNGPIGLFIDAPTSCVFSFSAEITVLKF